MIFFYFFIIIISDFCWQADTHDVRQLKERKGKEKKGGGKKEHWEEEADVGVRIRC